MKLFVISALRVMMWASVVVMLIAMAGGRFDLVAAFGVWALVLDRMLAGI